MNKSRLLTFGFLLLLITFWIPTNSFAQQADKGLLEALEEFFQQDYMSFGMLLQSQGEVHWNPDAPGENTFRIPAARLKVYGELDNNFGYVLQTNFAGSPSVLDANISYTFSDQFRITTGAMKPGISAEFLTSAANTDFINRSRIVGILVQRRDLGVLAQAELTEGLVLTGGMYNGRNQNLTNNDNHFYYTGRIAGGSEFGSDGLILIGFNIAHSGYENGTVIGNGNLPRINGQRTILGGDIRFEYNRFLLSGEILGASLEFTPGTPDEIYGFHITGGVWATGKLQLLARYDYIDSESNQVVFAEDDLLFGGINYHVTDAASFQLSYQVNPDEIDYQNQILLAQMQIAF